jgi:alpha-2-macroglobulin
MKQGWQARCRALIAGLAFCAAWGATHAARVSAIVPSGDVAEVRQVQVRFDGPVQPQGDPRAPAPYTLACNGSAPAGQARWLNDRQWVFDLQQPLAAGQRCVLTRAAGAPAFEGPAEHRFATGAPVVLQARPWPGSRIEEDQHFLLQLNGLMDDAAVQRAAWCEVQGLGERIPVRVVGGAEREAVLKLQRRAYGDTAEPGPRVLLACQRSFAPDAGMRLVWRGVQRFEWKVRPRLLAEFSCERENARAPCLPLKPLALRFNAPVQRTQALAARLVPAQGAAIAPKADGDERGAFITELRFAAPLPENTRFTLTLPAPVQDEAGRTLANAASFPLAVATGGLPPLAKFSGAPFGILEAGSAEQPALLPVTLRHVQADLAGASTGGQLRIKRLDPATPDATLLQWLARLDKDNADQYETRTRSLLATEADAVRTALPQPQPTPETARATEVLGIPLPKGGYHVVEVESRVLGHALLEKKQPMYARTGVLVSRLAVHFKQGRSSSLVWVTTLDRAKPVAGAQVAVNDCNGQVLWSGSTGADGIARIERGFEDRHVQRCASNDGHFVTARHAGELAFVFSRWAKGIEPWRFDLATTTGSERSRRAHTVFDRTLLRVGEAVSMKHFVREETATGLALPAPETLPDEVVITHVGSDTVTRLPLAWPRGARSAETRWPIPATAALGLYDVALQRGNQRLASGSFRVEAFRVPLVDARLAGPSGLIVAPKELALAAQVGAMAGGPMPALPLKLSALLRPSATDFAGYAEFSFAPPGRGAREDDNEPTAGDGAQVVANQIAASTDAAGAARFTIPALPALAGPAELQAELSFTDPNGETQTVSQRLKLWPAAVVAGIRVPGWTAIRSADPGGATELAFTAVVLSTDGRPLKGRAVQVRGVQHTVLSTRKRIVGGFYAYDNRRESNELGVLCSGSTDAQGRLACTAPVKASGEVEFIAEAADDAGRRSVAAASAWVASGERWWFEPGNDDRIDLLPEKRELQPGETARLQLRMPFAQATALVTVEREGVIDARVMTLTGRQPVIELPIPKAANDASWAPNVIVSALVLRGRLREAPWWSFFTWGWKDPGDWWRAFRHEDREYRAPSAMVDLAKPSFKLGVAELKIGRAEHRLDVKVSAPQPQYKVRETVKATVSVRTPAGQPLAGGEIAFAAVDEGLLALATNGSWDLLEALLQDRAWGVQTATAVGEVIGRRHHGRKALPPGGGGGRNATRELFDTLLLWRGTVVLDANGQATIDVPLNDSLTSFRLVAIADDGGQRFGSGSTSVRVTQDLQLLPGLSPIARAGDRFEAGYTLRNGTARAMTVRATLAGTADGQPITPAPAAQTVQLAAGAAAEVRWLVQAPEGSRRVEWQAAAEETGGAAGAARDRVKTVQQVQAAVPERVWQASLMQMGPLEGRAPVPVTLPVAPPADALPGSGRLAVSLQPTLSGALPGLRRWFEAYAFTCLEQQASRAIALADEAAWARLRDEAAGYLDADGLAHYFPPTPGGEPRGSDRLTAYLISAAHEAGRAWPDGLRERMLQGLAAFVEGRIERRSITARRDLDVRKLAALDALARHGRVQPRLLDSIAWAPAAWPTSAVLDAWSLYRRTPALPASAERTAELDRLLRSRLVAGGTTLKFSTEASDDWWWLMDGPDANAARLVLAAADSPAWKDDVPALVNGALARQRRGAWLTTTANLWGVLALTKFGARFESVPVAGRSELTLGTRQAVLDWAAAPAGDTLALPLPEAGTLSVQHQGTGRPWLTVQSLAAVPLKAPLFAGYRISKTVTPVQRKLPDAWSRGDIVRVRIEVDALTDMAWVVIADPIPAGSALLGTGLGRDSAIATRGEKREGSAWPAYEERAADAWRGYYEWLPRGRQVVEYTLRLNTAGRFGLPPTRVEAMYAPESFGELPNTAWEVRP